ncbi:hypothetical protein CIK05_12920 [Bdellovibrio sp. qaytius]|nr:hypothetical protein CIK05_12920 [Bdellovibrio sp. qaytius]
MKKLSVIAALLLLASCGHKTMVEDDRMPSSVTTMEVQQCGWLSSSETSRNAVDLNSSEKIDDRAYVMQLDCNNDQVLDTDSERSIVGFPMNQITPAQKGWITRWRKIAVKVQKDQSAKPYVCAKFSAPYNPCTAKRNSYGLAPVFSSKVVVAKKVN